MDKGIIILLVNKKVVVSYWICVYEILKFFIIFGKVVINSVLFNNLKNLFISIVIIIVNFCFFDI